jgi:hypothetical protein
VTEDRDSDFDIYCFRLCALRVDVDIKSDLLIHANRLPVSHLTDVEEIVDLLLVIPPDNSESPGACKKVDMPCQFVPPTALMVYRLPISNVHLLVLPAMLHSCHVGVAVACKCRLSSGEPLRVLDLGR